MTFFKRLEKYYEEHVNTLLSQTTQSSIFSNSTDKGTSREKLYTRFLEACLPSSCNVFLGGFLFDDSGCESKQTDIINYNEDDVRATEHLYEWLLNQGVRSQRPCSAVEEPRNERV